MITPVRRSSVIMALLALALFHRVIFLGETLVASDFLQASPLWSEIPGPIRNPALSDTIEYYYPAETMASDALRRGEIPIDNPYVFNGTPVPHGVHIWNSVWPIKLLFLGLFDPLRSYDFFAIFHWWLAGVAMAAYLRHRGRSEFAAFAGALAYALSARAATWLHGHYMMATLAYAPFAFLAGERRSLWTSLPMAGLFYTNPQAALATAAALFFKERWTWRTSTLGALFAAPALVPLALTMSGGVRHPGVEAAAFWQEGIRSWGLALDLLWPGLWRGTMTRQEYAAYIGLLPLLGVALVWREERFWARAMALVFAAATFWPLPVWLAPISFSLTTRYLFLFALGAAVLFSRALDARVARPGARAVVVLLLLIDLAPRFYAHNRPYDPAPLKAPPAVASLNLENEGRVGWILEDHPQLGRPVTPPLSLWRIPSIQGYDVMVPKAQAEAVGEAAWVRGDRLLELKDPGHPKLEALGLRWVLADRPLELKTFVPRGRAAGVWIYENPSAASPPPRRSPRWPLWTGAALALLAAALTGVVARLSRAGYSAKA
jgi:hypothetical protein